MTPSSRDDEVTMAISPSNRALLSPAYRTTITVFLSIVIVLTILGNLLTMIVMLSDKRLRAHRVSSLYIASLAGADLLVGAVVMTFMLLYTITYQGKWMFGFFTCALWTYVDYVSCTASLSNVFLIAVDRYRSVSQPLKAIRRRTRRRASWMLLAAWITPAVFWISVMCSGRMLKIGNEQDSHDSIAPSNYRVFDNDTGSPGMLVHGVTPATVMFPSTLTDERDQDPDKVCDTEWKPPELSIVIIVIIFYIPLLAIFVLFGLIMSVLRRHMTTITRRMRRTVSAGVSAAESSDDYEHRSGVVSGGGEGVGSGGGAGVGNLVGGCRDAATGGASGGIEVDASDVSALQRVCAASALNQLPSTTSNDGGPCGAGRRKLLGGGSTGGGDGGGGGRVTVEKISMRVRIITTVTCSDAQRGSAANAAATADALAADDEATTFVSKFTTSSVGRGSLTRSKTEASRIRESRCGRRAGGCGVFRASSSSGGSRGSRRGGRGSDVGSDDDEVSSSSGGSRTRRLSHLGGSRTLMMSNQYAIDAGVIPSLLSSPQPRYHRYASELRARRQGSLQETRLRQQIKAAKMLGAMTGFLLLCWIPFSVMLAVRAFCPDCLSQRTFDIATWINYMNSGINPIIYCLCNSQYRLALRNLARRVHSACKRNCFRLCSADKT